MDISTEIAKFFSGTPIIGYRPVLTGQGTSRILPKTLNLSCIEQNL
ncbi:MULTISPECIES: hypothetical protein [Nostoc]|uniref:Uncharacterized protein n=1 Tax=Nostoc edaphicum CCNP1411 TaxID=1472755 RepID=A0A7D7LJ46_9NOSO|nr:hypothetical protein [Nostoc edaphicum]QMS92172.1 hypothetical protein HUN01_32950 [Nostoc edaphicum CCNP1411]